MAAAAALVERVLAGGDRPLELRAARGLLPLPPEELLPLQVALARRGDVEVASAAAAALAATDPRLVAHHLSAGADLEELAYFAAHVDHPLILEAILRRRDVPRPLLVELAPRLHEDLQELLLLRQDAILEEPAILEALAQNPRLSSYSRRRIGEYRDHLLPRSAVAEPPAPAAAEPAAPAEEPWDEEVAAAVAEARELPAGGERDGDTGLSEVQVRSLPIPVRLKLARGASRTLRAILLRDPQPRVAVAVLTGTALSDQEVEQICHNRSVCEEVLEAIAQRREWSRKYQIVRALVGNPKTPLAVSMKLVPRLSVRDLRDLSRSHNVPDAVRSAADRLYKIKRH